MARVKRDEKKKVSRDFEATMLSLLNSHLHIPSAELFVSTSQYVVYGKRISHLEKHKKQQTATQKQMSIRRVGGAAWPAIPASPSEELTFGKLILRKGLQLYSSKESL